MKGSEQEHMQKRGVGGYGVMKLKTMLKTANVKLGRVWREETRRKEAENKERGGEGRESGGDKRVS